MGKKFKVYISDYDYADNEIEKSVLEPIGAEVIGLKDNTGKTLPEKPRMQTQSSSNMRKFRAVQSSS